LLVHIKHQGVGQIVQPRATNALTKNFNGVRRISGLPMYLGQILGKEHRVLTGTAAYLQRSSGELKMSPQHV
jgi:hypothetical protein